MQLLSSKVVSVYRKIYYSIAYHKKKKKMLEPTENLAAKKINNSRHETFETYILLSIVMSFQSTLDLEFDVLHISNPILKFSHLHH